VVAHTWDERVIDQLRTIKDTFESQTNEVTGEPYVIKVTPPDAPGANYMYVEGEILVRDEYVERVQEVIGPPAPSAQLQRVVRGVQRHPIDPAKERPLVEHVIPEIERVHGRGIATPNHVLTVAGVGGPCPATEPEEVYAGIEPFPVVPAGGGAGVLIYIADTGLVADADQTSPWLRGVERARDAAKPREFQEWDYPRPAAGTQAGEADAAEREQQEGPPFIPPYAGHGTFVAGVTRCIAPEAEIIVANIFKTAGSALESDFVKELDQALDLGVDIFNLSVTAPTLNDRPLLAFRRWLERAQEYKGVVCVAAAGNSALRYPSWPAACPEVVSVGALAGDWRTRADFTNYGGWVDVYAPGRNIVNAFPVGEYVCKDAPYAKQQRNFYGMARWSGTSFSTPIVTGLIAARMSRTGENGKEAAAALLAEARAQAIPGTGAILLPYENGAAAA
jgi:subtilisin family serine protease